MAREQDVIRLMSGDISLWPRPFRAAALALGISEGALIRRLKEYKKSGLMRKFSAVLNHRRLGIRYNAMVVWSVPDKKIIAAGRRVAEFDAVSHCYQRKTARGWDYNLYAMVHNRDKARCLRVIEEISRSIGDYPYKVLFSTREYKKSGARYG